VKRREFISLLGGAAAARGARAAERADAASSRQAVALFFPVV
jgi:hypothetical protein